jgi:hypothetical protein
LFLQDPGSQAFGPGVFVTMQGAAGNRTVAENSAAMTAMQIADRRNITVTVSTFSA